MESGGIVAIWDTSYFTLTNSLDGDGFLALVENLQNISGPCLFIVVYAPQDHRKKKKLWSDISCLIATHNTLSIVIGDFNEVRHAGECKGSIFDTRGVRFFNDFISSSGLQDLSMCAKSLASEGKRSRIFEFYLCEKIDSIDSKAENSSLSIDEILLRTTTVKSLAGLEHAKIMDLRQKAKIRWALKGDENLSNLFKHFSLDEVQFLDRPFSNLEIKDADIIEKDVISFVKHFETSSHIPKGCNSSFIIFVPKLDDPLVVGDFRPISLIGCQYKIIAKVLANHLPKVLASVVGDVQMAFIKGRQIIDGPIMIDEIITWAKKCKKKMMFLKVDFEKDFDSLSWSFLLYIMKQVGFSSKWRKWIHSCLNSSFAPILINGSPNKEFKLEKPFLFILAVEALNVALTEATNNNFFNGIKVDINLPMLFKRKIGDGQTTRRIRSQAETTELNDLTNLLLNLHLTNNMDTWEFIPDASRRFTVNNMRKLISLSTINTNNCHHTRWNKLLPSKVNILTWRVSNKRFPTRSNLDSRGIDLDSTRCPLCDNDIETEDHVLVYCPSY
ncbi:putative RNA-directed DNA polymerase, eukaryota, reverse transcriptase zinc-binding domain protein [Tanacetum coccineum]|uniref:RNA-directed DNA polymerase, eukaryota, reverse transcriptase zinc-binding domain protein n=1 Tax=Tanacetum coccineum TaxID=301880 RepID=A0ABQ5IM72_9ASTR